MNFQESDEGDYKCVFRTIINPHLVAQTVFADFVASVVINTPNDLVYRHFTMETTRLLCDPQNHNEIEWQEVTSTGSNHPVSLSEVELDGTDLVFHSLNLDNNGEYACVAENELGHKSVNARLFVYGK